MFENVSLCMFVLCVNAIHACHSACVVRGQLLGVNSFALRVLGVELRLLWLSDKCFYTMSSLAGSSILFIETGSLPESE